MTLDLREHLDDVRLCDRKAEPPSRQYEGQGNGVDDDEGVWKLGEPSRRRGMLLRVVNEEFIGLNEDQKDALGMAELDNRSELVLSDDGSGRVVRRVQNQTSRLVSNDGLDVAKRRSKVIGRIGLGVDRMAAGEKDLIRKADPVGRRNDDLIARRNQGQHEIEKLLLPSGPGDHI